MSVAELEGVEKLRRDLREAAGGLGHREARFLVDAYYAEQEKRIEAANQMRALSESEEPNAVIEWLLSQHHVLENEIKKALGPYTDAHEVGVWSRSITGIGPVLAAGLLAHIDIERSQTVGQIWSFAGLNPDVRWEKGQRRPWNASLKVLCWKIGESFVKVSGNKADVYGKVYAARKALEIERNEGHMFADQAKRSLEEKKYAKSTDAYKWYIQGMLPPARLHLRAQRYAVKLFLAGWFEVGYFSRYGVLPAKPYVIEHLGHAGYYGVPNVHLVPGLREAYDVQGPRSAIGS